MIKPRTGIKLIEWTAAAFVLLYLYTGITKAIHHEEFIGAIRHSSLIARYAFPLSIIVPAVEILIAVLLIIPGTRRAGLISATALLAVFTTYIIYIFLDDRPLPCSCGGIIEKMSWQAHLIFNACFFLLGCVAIFFNYQYKNIIAMSRSSRTPVKYSRQSFNQHSKSEL